MKTLEDLLDVLVVDKLRDGLGHKHKLHVLNNTREQQRVSARDLANLLDVYTAEFDNVDTSSGSNQNRNNARFNSSTSHKSFSARAFTFEPDNCTGIFETHSIKADSQKLQQGSERDKQAKPLSANKNRIRCFACNQEGHVSSVCPQYAEAAALPQVKQSKRKVYIPAPGKICFVCGSEQHGYLTCKKLGEFIRKHSTQLESASVRRVTIAPAAQCEPALTFQDCDDSVWAQFSSIDAEAIRTQYSCPHRRFEADNTDLHSIGSCCKILQANTQPMSAQTYPVNALYPDFKENSFPLHINLSPGCKIVQAIRDSGTLISCLDLSMIGANSVRFRPVQESPPRSCFWRPCRG